MLKQIDACSVAVLVLACCDKSESCFTLIYMISSIYCLSRLDVSPSWCLYLLHAEDEHAALGILVVSLGGVRILAITAAPPGPGPDNLCYQ